MKNCRNEKHMIHALKLQLGHRSPRTTLSYTRDPLFEHLRESLKRFKIKKETEEPPEERS
jgi:hypothetical protein